MLFYNKRLGKVYWSNYSIVDNGTVVGNGTDTFYLLPWFVNLKAIDKGNLR